VLEVASYVGSFLAFAGERGATATGLDPNPEMVRWCRGLGLDARLGVLEERRDTGRCYDSIWVLNCFDQLPDPIRMLRAARRLVRAGGRLVIRTPNAAFLRAACSRPRDLRSSAREHLLWGMPYLCCYTTPAIGDLLRRTGFTMCERRGRPNEVADVTDLPGEPPWVDIVAVATADLP
jgi:SAM-dependent methyltransferase